MLSHTRIRFSICDAYLSPKKFKGRELISETRHMDKTFGILQTILSWL